MLACACWNGHRSRCIPNGLMEQLSVLSSPYLRRVWAAVINLTNQGEDGLKGSKQLSQSGTPLPASLRVSSDNGLDPFLV